MAVAEAITDDVIARGVEAIARQRDIFLAAIKALPQDAPSLAILGILDTVNTDWLTVEPGTDGFLASHATAIWGSRIEPASAWNFAQPTLDERNYYADALSTFEARDVINAAEFDAIVSSLDAGTLVANMPEAQAAAHAESFTMIREANQTIIEKVATKTAQTIQEGGTIADFVHDINDIYAAAGIDDQAFWYTELVYRNNMNRAFQEGVDLVSAELNADGILWGYEWIHSGSARPRESHLALDGFTAPATDPRWGQIGTPPAGHNCGCRRRAVTDFEAEERGLSLTPPTPTIGAGDHQGKDAIDTLNTVPGERFQPSKFQIPERPFLNPSWDLPKEG